MASVRSKKPQAKTYTLGLYEKKLPRVMARLGVTEHDWDHGRYSAWVSFRYKGQLYRFEHTVEKAKAAGQNIERGVDCFCQIVLALEDLVRMVERGIYDLTHWVQGMKALPPGLPECYLLLGLGYDPTRAEVKQAFTKLAKEKHPDVGGDPEDFKRLMNAYEEAMARAKEALGR